MFSKTMSRYAVSVLGLVFVMSLCIGLPGAIANEEPGPCDPGDPEYPDCIYGCSDDALFTQEFFLDDCKFEDKGVNPYFIIKPGYQLVLEFEEEKSVETVLCDTKIIELENGRRIRTRVVEERAWEEGVLVEISLNWFAICKKTNAVYYFGEFSRDCDPATGGFDPDDERFCANGSDPIPAGSWEAGVDGAKPGLIMPGTALMGAKYFQEIAEDQEAVDRGQIVTVGLEEPEEWSGLEIDDWADCIEIHDTNPMEAEDGGCIGENDVKLYCRGVGLVADQDLVLVERRFVGCGGDDDDDDDDDDKRRRHRKYRSRH